MLAVARFGIFSVVFSAACSLLLPFSGDAATGLNDGGVAYDAPAPGNDATSVDAGLTDATTQNDASDAALNLLPNGDMETFGCDAWAIANGIGTTIIDAPHGGRKACRMCASAAGYVYMQSAATSLFAPKGDRIYATEAFARLAPLTSSGPRVYVAAAGVDTSATKNVYVNSPEVQLTATWTRLNVLLPLPVVDGGYQYGSLSVSWVNANVGECIDVDDLAVY
jgi:hypothetical protein